MKRSTPSGTPKSPTKPVVSTTSWTVPKPAEVIGYSYLWYREAQAGRDEGTKDRPVVVVLAAVKRPIGTQLLVVPITTRSPRVGDLTLEVPAAVRRHLGLGEEQCWIVADEGNWFTWPGPDIRPARQIGDLSPSYGFIPARLFEQLRPLILQRAQANRFKKTPRTE